MSLCRFAYIPIGNKYSRFNTDERSREKIANNEKLPAGIGI